MVRNILDCRTSRLGGHVRRCDADACGFEEISYNSCRDRHCPKCQFLARANWVEARIAELLPVQYFHVVFTLPQELKALCLQNPKELYALLFQSASATLKEVMERKLSAEAGFIAVLHTWDQKLNAHPHLHVIVPGGGLKRGSEVGDGACAPTSDSWVSCKQGFLLPVQILSKVFRGKFLSNLEKLHAKLKFEGRLAGLSDLRRFKKLLAASAQKNWVVYAKPPFAGPEAVIKYLGAYTHRIAISNYRLIKIESDHVVFSYRDSADGNKRKQMRLHVQEFMRRFLIHVLPHGFVRIRHFGFLGNRYRKTKIERLKAILIPQLPSHHAVSKVVASPEKVTWQDRFQALTGIDPTLCSKCKQGKMQEIRVIKSFYERRRRDAGRKAWDTS